MIYILTVALLLIGIGYHVLASIGKLRLKFPELTMQTIWTTFFKEEWDSLLRSALGVVLFQIGLFIAIDNDVDFDKLANGYGTYIMYAFAVVWGYAGQRLAYRILNTSESKLAEKVDRLKQDNG